MCESLLFPSRRIRASEKKKKGVNRSRKMCVIYVAIDDVGVAALLLNYRINKTPELFSTSEKEPDFLLYFYQLKNNTKSSIEKLDSDFSELRINIPKYDGKYRTFLIQRAAKQVQTVTKNNVTVHMFSKCHRYFMHLYAKEKTKAQIHELVVVNQLFNDEPNVEELDSFRKQFKCEHVSFKNQLESTWWLLFEVMYHLQKHFSSIQVKTVKFVPNFSFGRKHLLYTTDALRELLASLKLKILRHVAKLRWLKK
jgi:hypothetical protein